MKALTGIAYIILYLLCITVSSCTPQNVSFTIHVQSVYPLDPHEGIYIAGNQAVLGNWNASAVPLLRVKDGWTSRFIFPKGTNLEFKLTKGSWDAEALNAEARVPSNYQFTINRDTLVQYTIPLWKDSLLNTDPSITGEYRIHESFPVKGLDARRVIVWLPPSYQDEAVKRYPVLYLHDGQNVFDPYTSTLGYDWRVDEVGDSLIRNGEIGEFIAVAIYCDTDARTWEYSDDADLGEKYQDFMCCQLKPWIDSVYRTRPEAEHTAVMGASMGGLISFILAWEYPHVFSMAACMSPAFKISVGDIKVDYVAEVLSDPQKKHIDLYIDNGTVDLEAMLQPGIDEMRKALTEKGYPYTWYLDKGAPHNEQAWASRVWKPLLQFFGNQ